MLSLMQGPGYGRLSKTRCHRKCCKSPKLCSIPKFVPVFIICICLPCSSGLLGLFESSLLWLGSLLCSIAPVPWGRDSSSLFSSSGSFSLLPSSPQLSLSSLHLSLACLFFPPLCLSGQSHPSFLAFRSHTLCCLCQTSVCMF